MFSDFPRGGGMASWHPQKIRYWAHEPYNYLPPPWHNLTNMASIRSCLRVVCSCLKRDLLLVLIIVGVFLGFLIGALVNEPVQDSANPMETIMYISFPGEILMRMLKMVILPLIVSSLIVALAVLDAKAAGRLGRRALIYYFTTTILAVVLGIILVVSIKPGEGKGDSEGTESKHVQPVDSLLDLIRYIYI